LGNLIDWNNPEQLHGFSHPREEFHEQLAAKFVDKLLNNE
jgi:hypothetical protein